MASLASPPPKGSMNGILAIPAFATQKPSPSSQKSASTKAASSKSTSPRLKLVVRRLPPSLSQAEFETALGDEWRIGAGKIDWCVYKEGKISKECVSVKSGMQRSI